MIIYFATHNEIGSLEVEASQTVFQVKQRLSDKFGFQGHIVGSFRMLFIGSQGTQFTDFQTLYNCNVKEGDVIRLVVKFPGDQSKGKSPLKLKITERPEGKKQNSLHQNQTCNKSGPVAENKQFTGTQRAKQERSEIEILFNIF